MKNYLMELVALVSLLLMVGLVAWHTKTINICQAAETPQTNVSAPLNPGQPEGAAKPETTNEPPAATGLPESQPPVKPDTAAPQQQVKPEIAAPQEPVKPEIAAPQQPLKPGVAAKPETTNELPTATGLPESQPPVKPEITAPPATIPDTAPVTGGQEQSNEQGHSPVIKPEQADGVTQATPEAKSDAPPAPSDIAPPDSERPATGQPK